MGNDPNLGLLSTILITQYRSNKHQHILLVMKPGYFVVVYLCFAMLDINSVHI